MNLQYDNVMNYFAWFITVRIAIVSVFSLFWTIFLYTYYVNAAIQLSDYFSRQRAQRTCLVSKYFAN